jgi:hypothetical protein
MAELIQPKQIDFTNFDVPITGSVVIVSPTGSSTPALTVSGSSIFRARTDDEYSLIVSGAMAVVDNYVAASIDDINRTAVSASIFVQRVGTIGTTNPVGNTQYQLPGVIDLGGFF